MSTAGIDPENWDQCYKRWWHSNNNLRLSSLGYDFLCGELKLERYTFELPEQGRSQLLILLHNKMDSPYYLHTPRYNAVNYSEVTIFNSKDAMTILLANNDLLRYFKEMKD